MNKNEQRNLRNSKRSKETKNESTNEETLNKVGISSIKGNNEEVTNEINISYLTNGEYKNKYPLVNEIFEKINYLNDKNCIYYKTWIDLIN